MLQTAHLCCIPRGYKLQPYRGMGHRIRELTRTADTFQSEGSSPHCASWSLSEPLQKAGARTPLPESLIQAALEGPKRQCVLMPLQVILNKVKVKGHSSNQTLYFVGKNKNQADMHKYFKNKSAKQ